MKPIVAATLLLCAACATQPRYVYHRDGATPRDLEVDSATCRAQAMAAKAEIFTELAILDACMQGKGWRTVPSGAQ